jgi:hypothetical protein
MGEVYARFNQNVGDGAAETRVVLHDERELVAASAPSSSATPATPR